MKFSLENIFNIKHLVRHLAAGLSKLSFSDNFDSFESSVIIPATSELKVRNRLKSVPTKYIIVGQTGNGLITRGATEWSLDHIYLYNNGSVSVTVNILFLK